MKVGLMIPLDNKLEQTLDRLTEMNMQCGQIVCWDEAMLTEETAQRIIRETAKRNVKISALWCGWPGPCKWDFYEGQLTLGLVPAAYRYARYQVLCKGSDFAKAIGVNALVTHVGYLPENPYDENYRGVVLILREIAQKCKENDQWFLFETGQETPVTLLRTIEDIGMDNVGINLDPANLLMYGSANPVDAMDIFGKYVRGVHGKDGEYPTTGKMLGQEKPVGQGRVDFPALLKKLREFGYDGDLTIECEIDDNAWENNILTARDYLQGLLRNG